MNNIARLVHSAGINGICRSWLTQLGIPCPLVRVYSPQRNRLDVCIWEWLRAQGE